MTLNTRQPVQTSPWKVTPLLSPYPRCHLMEARGLMSSNNLRSKALSCLKPVMTRPIKTTPALHQFPKSRLMEVRHGISIPLLNNPNFSLCGTSKQF